MSTVRHDDKYRHYSQVIFSIHLSISSHTIHLSHSVPPSSHPLPFKSAFSQTCFPSPLPLSAKSINVFARVSTCILGTPTAAIALIPHPKVGPVTRAGRATITSSTPFPSSPLDLPVAPSVSFRSSVSASPYRQTVSTKISRPQCGSYRSNTKHVRVYVTPHWQTTSSYCGRAPPWRRSDMRSGKAWCRSL